MDVQSEILSNGDLKLTIAFDADETDDDGEIVSSDREECEEKLASDPEKMLDEICKAFFNGNYRFWGEYDEDSECSDLEPLLTTIYPHDGKSQKANQKLYDQYAAAESWTYPDTSRYGWIRDLVEKGSIILSVIESH